MFKDLVYGIIDLINLLVPVLGGVAVALFMLSMVRYIYQSGDVKNRARARATAVWGLVALFLLFSIWGVIRLLDESFFGGRNSGGARSPIGEPLDIRPESIR